MTGEVLSHKRSPQWVDKGTYKEVKDTDNVRVPRLEVDDATTYVDKDGSDNLTLTDAVTGTKTLAQLAAGAAGGVDTSGTPVTDDYARFTDADTIEGRDYTEVKTDLSLNLVENTAHSTDTHTMTLDGRDVSADGTKLDTIATNATKYPDTGEQAFLDADHSKLDAIAANATKYPDTGEQAFLDADHSKLDAIGAGADVVGPASSVDNAIARFHETTGKIIQDYTSSAPTVSDDGIVTLAAMLDMGGQAIGDGTLELVTFTETASAVNNIHVANSATSDYPSISVVGDDTNIAFHLAPKGTGHINIDRVLPATAAQELDGLMMVVDSSAQAATSIFHALEVETTGTPAGEVAALATVGKVKPLHQHVATPTTPSQTEFAGLKSGGGNTWADGLDGIEIFVADDDAIFVGGATQFDEIEVIMGTAATKSVSPTFWYNTAADAWTPFFPSDGTEGFTISGNISWSVSEITATWTGDGDPGVDDTTAGYWIKIVRTRVADPGTPTPTTIKIGVTTEYEWDETGAITANTLKVFDAGGETITGDGTDMTIASGNLLNLTATTDVVIPVNVGLHFGDGAEKIESNNTDFTINSGGELNLTASSDVVIPVNIGLHLGDGTSKLESNDTDLTINAGGDINLTAVGDVNIPANIGVTFGDDGEKIEGNATDLTIAGNNINLTAVADVVIPANVGVTFGTGEKIEGNNTDLTITSGGAINLTATTNVVIPTGLTGVIRADSGVLSVDTDVTDIVSDMVGDSGSGGTAGLVPAPEAGDTAAGKYLKADGAWTVPAGGGDVAKVGTPANNQIGVWTGDGTLEGDTELTYDDAAFKVGLDGTAKDVYFYSATAGDWLFWDGTNKVLNIIGTNAATALNVSDGNVIVADTFYLFDAGGESLSSDGTDLTINAGQDLNLTAATDINIPANVGLTFGDDGEKIEGNATDLTIAGNNINLTAVADVVIPANVGVTFGTGEKIEGDNTDLTVTSGGAINLTAVTDVVVPANIGVTFGTGEKVEGDNTDLTVTSGGDIALTATGDVNIPASVGVTFGDDGEKIEGDGTDLTISSSNILNISASGNMLFAENTGLEWDNALSADGKYSGIVTKQFNGGATIPFGEIMYLKAADSEWYQAKADVTATSGAVMVGICVLATTDGNACTALLIGKVRADTKFPTFTISAPVFISAATAGLLTSTAPTGTTNFVVRIVGHAGTGDEIYFNPSNSYVELA